MLLLHSLLEFVPSSRVVVVLVGLYVLPTIVAAIKRGPVWLLTMAVNIALGWTVIGWVVALAWAVRDSKGTPPT